MRHRLLLVGILAVVSMAALFSTAFAHTYNGIVEISCTAFNASGTGSDVLDRDNTGTGQEQVRIDVVDGAGTLLYTLTFEASLSSYSGGLIPPTNYTAAPQYNPISVIVTSLEGNGLPEVVEVLGTGNCAGLPTFGASAGCIAYSGAVMGDMPFSTQAFYAPGKEASGVVINPGTYLVLGTDESGQFYQIILACETLWVPVGSMQPSFQPLWNGQPLPTTVVE
ncbi:MAG: hypothetical protein ABI835_07170 [Chloroflexota bacterium]